MTDDKEMDFIKKAASGTIRAFLDGKKTLLWAINSQVQNPELRGQILTEILEGFKGYGDQERYQELVNACRERGLIE